jgi:short-subunit dehydrogenase
MVDSNFKDRYGDWALITGATSGIGAEMARQIAAKGINIVLVARKEKELAECEASLQDRYGIKTKCVSADLATNEGVEKVKRVDEEIGLLVIAAGLEVNGAFEKTSLESELKLIQINVIATLQLTHHFSKAMIQREKGGILLVSSLSGHMPNPYFSNYAGSKAYVLNLGASLYGELKPKGVDVTILSPGLTNTPMVADNGVDWSKTPMKAMDPAVVAKKGLSGLGKQLLSVPGGKNKMMAFMSKHSPLEMQAKMNEKMMRKAIDRDRM